MRRYNPKEIEPRWQQVWEESGIYKASEDKSRPKKYILEYFPYPSGAAMHVGHVRNYTIGDTVSRFMRMSGYNVLHPMGWDGFGLPAENYAIKTGISPRQAIDENTAKFKQQLMQMGFSYDWSREIDSTDPDYYKWTQWFFLFLYKKGLAYQKDSLQWWCPFDKTVLANEQVENGRCWRCGNLVEKKALKQWFFKITEYADRLDNDLKDLDWSDAIKAMQHNWIGRSEGAEISWKVSDAEGNETGASFETFTTRKDTIPGVTFIVVAPEYEKLDELTSEDHKARVHSYRQEATKLTDIQRQENKEKSGVFTGLYAINPFNGKIVPIYVANYVLAGYGTGAVMGMGGHDERDREFSLQHNIPVILTTEVPEEYQDLSSAKVYAAKSGKQINSGEPYDGLDNMEAGRLIFEKLKADGAAHEKVNYKIRDWLISRQRYWGAPIPIIHCEKCGIQPVPEADLPVVLPEVKSYEPTGDGRSPLANVPEFVNVKCPNCGGDARRETDTMDGFACSSWYFLRFADPRNDKEPFAKEKAEFWLPVDDYIGGAEHAVMHLLYARFWTKVMFDDGLISFSEPFLSLRNQGMILAPDGQKMSKSKGNTIEPDELLAHGYGADSIRLMELFIGPWDQAVSWSVEGIGGTFRFLQRYWTLVEEFLEAKPEDNPKDLELTSLAHKTIRKVTKDISSMSFNTAIAAMMELANDLYKAKAEQPMTQSAGWRFALESMTLLLAPFAPHITEEVWRNLGHEESAHVSQWPEWDENLVAEEVITIAVQINGKVRSEIVIAADSDEAEVITAAKSDEKIKPHLQGKTIKKEIYVPGRLVSLVI